MKSAMFLGGSTAAAAFAAVVSVATFGSADLAKFARFDGARTAVVEFAAVAADRAKSFLQLMSQRSPGERVKGELIKTKGKKYQVLAERAPPELAMPPLTGLVDVLAAPPAMLPGGIAFPVAELTPPTNLPPGVTIFPPPGGIIVPPCCGVVPPPGPPPPPPGPPPPPPPPPPAVPEPGTWMTMILGFGFTGWLFRRRRALEGRAARS